MIKITFSKFFIFVNLWAVVFASPLAIATFQTETPLFRLLATKNVTAGGGIAYRENLLTSMAECIPLYLVAVIFILIFFMYKPKECSLFALPLAYALLIPLYICVLLIFGPVINGFVGLDTWAIYFATRFVYFYSLPLIAITLGLAFYLNKYLEKRVACPTPFLLRLGDYPIQKKKKVLMINIIVMVVLQVILLMVSTIL